MGKKTLHGEGNHEADKEYRERTRDYLERADVEKDADEAKRALKGEEGEKLRRAEEKGKSHARR